MMTIPEHLLEITHLYESNVEDFLKAQNNPQHINYLVGKLMVNTKGKADPKVSLLVIKALVFSELPNIRKVTING